MEHLTNQYKTIEQVISRLNRRSELLSDAKLIFRESQGISSLGVSELEEIRGFCFIPPNNPPKPGDKPGARPGDQGVIFSCSKGQGYDESEYDPPCSKDTNYASCGANEKTVTCPESPPFNCPGKAYSCTSYDCPSEFVCKSKSDYECSGSLFECKKDFQCNGGHVFVCNHANNCPDIFGCEGGKNCTSPNKCANDGKDNYGCPDKSVHGVPPGPYGPFLENPGDFMCGFGMVTDSEYFTCPKDFECKGKDGSSDFMCANGTNFVCGQKGQGSFDCSLADSVWGAGFSCYQKTYECNGAKVSCNAAGENDYGCQFKGTSYSQCPAKSCTSKALYGEDPPPPPPWE